MARETEGIIRVMPETLANKIAAGEVVQRPASVLKELVENALDAGADAIDVLIKAAGSELVQVIDNGCGMHPVDAQACFKRHATSKIRSVDDLERLHTLGFRGEALASIGAVAHVDLKTKRVEDEAGVYVRVEGGAIVTAEPCAAPNGTSIAVRNLFYNVPARRNFLKTPATEFKHIVETFQFLALANPSVAFSLTHDGRSIYELQAARGGEQDALGQRIADLFDEEHARRLIHIEDASSYLSVRGVIAEPELRRRTRNEQFLFVNDRYVKHHYLEHAVRSAYEGLLPEDTYPFFALFLDLDPRHVDVNVHPTKAEVKFDDESGIYRFLKNVAKRALGMADFTPVSDKGDDVAWDDRLHGGNRPSTPTPIQPGSFKTESGRASSGDRPPFSFRDSERGRRHQSDLPGILSQQLYDLDEPAAEESDIEAFGLAFDDAAKVWHLRTRYIVTPTDSGLLVVDHVRAHERVLYEEALAHMRKGAGPSQQLLFPHTIDLNPADYELLQNLLPDLRALGFDIEKYSGRSVVVCGVPADVHADDEKTMLDDLLGQYKTFTSSVEIKTREALARSMSRQHAIPAGKRLSSDEMRSLLHDLVACEMPYACPQGRRTYVKVSFDELNYRFGS